MFHNSSSRNHRPKGSNVKRILQVVVLLAVACWLLYQVKHSREKKTENIGEDEIKLSKVGGEIYLGRKGDAGSENVVIIDTNAKGSDESTEMKQDEVRHDASVLNKEDISNELHQSPELANSQGSKEEENSYSLANDGENKLLLPSEEGNNSSEQNVNSNEGSRNIEENEHLKDNEKHEDVKTDTDVVDDIELTGDHTIKSSANQSENIKDSGKKKEEKSDGAGSEEVSVSDEASKAQEVGSYDRSSSEIAIDNKIDDRTGDYSRSDGANVSSSQGDVATTIDQVNDVFHVSDIGESRSDSNHELTNVDVSSGEMKTNQESEGEMKTNQESEEEMKNSFSDTKAQNSSDTSGTVFDESQVDSASVDSQTDKASEQESLSEGKTNEAMELQANGEVSGEVENSQNNSLESKNVTDNLEKEISVGGTVESQGNEKGKEGALNDEAVQSSEVNKKINFDDSTNKIPEEKVDNSEADSTNGSNGDESKSE